MATPANDNVPTPNQIRFPVEPRLVPAQKAARRLHLTEAEFVSKLDALLRAGLPPACHVTGHYDLKAIDNWLDRRASLGESSSTARNAADVFAERRARLSKIG